VDALRGRRHHARRGGAGPQVVRDREAASWEDRPRDSQPLVTPAVHHVLQEGGGGVPPAGFVPTAGSVKSSLLKGLLNGAPSEPLSVGAAAGARTTSPEVHTTPVSLAALASVERAHVPPDPPMRTQNSDPTSNSDASEATMAMSAIGPAELLLLQSAPSCHTSPLLSSQPPSSREENGAEVAELLLLQRTPSCHASPLLTTAMGAGGGVDVPAELTSSATDQVMESESLQVNLDGGRCLIPFDP